MKFYLVDGHVRFLTHKITTTQNDEINEQNFYDEDKKERLAGYLLDKGIEYAITEYPQPPAELLKRCEGKKFSTMKEAQDFINGTESIDSLKQQLTETDCMVIKSYEYQLAGLVLPYDIEMLHGERQAIRDKINQLEGE